MKKLPLMMAKPKNLQILRQRRGSRSHKEILEAAVEDALNLVQSPSAGRT